MRLHISVTPSLNTRPVRGEATCLPLGQQQSDARPPTQVYTLSREQEVCQTSPRSPPALPKPEAPSDEVQYCSARFALCEAAPAGSGSF